MAKPRFRQLVLADEDFVGADMARRFLQMGYTRSRRYAKKAWKQAVG